MPIRRYKPEQIVTMLRQIEVGIANGKTTPQACKKAAITAQTFYRWRVTSGKNRGETNKAITQTKKPYFNPSTMYKSERIRV